MDTEGRIRLATPADAAAIRSIYAPFVESTPVSFEEDPPDEAEMADRIASTLETHPWLVCERDGRVVGYASAGPLRSYAAYRWVVELSVYVAADARRSGVASALYESLFAVLERQGYRGAYAATTVPNPASVAFHERLGFESVGVFPDAGYTAGDWRDVRWFYHELGEHPSDPEEPIPLATVRGSPALEDAVRAGEGRLDG